MNPSFRISDLLVGGNKNKNISASLEFKARNKRSALEKTPIEEIKRLFAPNDFVANPSSINREAMA